MATLAHDEKIAIGHDNAGGLTRWNEIAVSGVVLLDPGAPPPWTTYSPGQEIAREDLTFAHIGFPSIQWVIPFVTVAQYNHLETTYNHKLVTVRTSIDGVAYANYNATFSIENRADLEDRWEYFSSAPKESPDMEGWGWQQVIITYTGMEAL